MPDVHCPKEKDCCCYCLFTLLRVLPFIVQLKASRSYSLKMKASKFGEVLYTHLCTTLLVGSFYPLAGVLADTFWGRYNVIKIGLWLIAFALGFICINLSIIDGVTESVGRIFLPITCILLIAIGSACMRWSQCYFLWGWPVATRLHIRPDKLLLFLVWFHSKCQYIVGSRCISFTTKRFSTILFPSSRRGPLLLHIPPRTNEINRHSLITRL